MTPAQKEAIADQLEARLHKGIYSLSLNVVQLKDEVKRLRKAGDAMADALNLGDDVFDNHEKHEAQEIWNAAKEGKQS